MNGQGPLGEGARSFARFPGAIRRGDPGSLQPRPHDNPHAIAAIMAFA